MPFSKLGLAPSLYAPRGDGLRAAHTGPGRIDSSRLERDRSLARAQTGTGKTAAFALPMIERLLLRGQRPKRRGPLGLVLVPTRELAVQVHGAFATYGAPARLRDVESTQSLGTFYIGRCTVVLRRRNHLPNDAFHPNAQLAFKLSFVSGMHLALSPTLKWVFS